MSTYRAFHDKIEKKENFIKIFINFCFPGLSREFPCDSKNEFE